MVRLKLALALDSNRPVHIWSSLIRASLAKPIQNRVQTEARSSWAYQTQQTTQAQVDFTEEVLKLQLMSKYPSRLSAIR